MYRYATLLVLTSLGCSGLRPLEDELGSTSLALVDAGTPKCPADAGTCVAVSSSAELDPICSDNRWVALLAEPGNACPSREFAGGSWVGTKLFQPSSEIPLPPGLRGYCVLQWKPSASLPASPNLTWLNSLDGSVFKSRGRDCAAVNFSGSAAALAGWNTLRSDLRNQMGWVSPLPRRAAFAPPPIRIAVIDSAPHVYAGGQAVDDRSGHGEAVGQLIHEISCPTSPSGTAACVGRISNHLALPQISLRAEDRANGGYFGFFSDAAQAIYSAVSDWREFNLTAPTPQPRMAANMSIAWDPKFGGEYQQVTDLEAPLRAIQQVMTHAACRGVLMIAAAGNATLGPDPTKGGMFPAAWETHPGPSVSDCQSMEGTNYPSAPSPALLPPAGVYAPLVHAVSALRGDDTPVSNSRPEGRARLAAPGSFAVAESATTPGLPTSVLTGSSPAAAIVSGMATALWGYRPTLTGAEIIQLIRDGGVSLSTPADFCLGGTHTSCPMLPFDQRRTIRRANFCQALSAACSAGLENCPLPANLPTCVSRPAYSGSLVRLTAADLAGIQVTKVASASSVRYAMPGLATCGDNSIVSHLPAYPERPCPQRQFYGAGAIPAIAPQPNENPCPACFLEQNNVLLIGGLTMSIDTSFFGQELFSPVLRINDSVDIDLSSVGRLTGGDVVRVDNIDLGMVVTRATISFAVPTLRGPEASTSSEVVVW